MSVGILINDANILTMDEADTVIKEGYILIQENKITQLGQGKYEGSIDGLEVINGKDMCAVPGLINCHTHAAMTLLRGYGEGLPLMRWLNEKIWPMEAKFREKHIRIGTNLAILEMLKTGTTFFNDMYFYQMEVLKAAEDANIRASLGVTIIGDDWKKQIEESDRILEYVSKNNNSGLISILYAPHSAYTVSPDGLKEVARRAKANSMGIHVHVSETDDETKIIRDKYNKTTAELLEETGIFDSNTVAAHCVHLSDSDIEILKRHNVNPVYNAQSNMKLASGTARISYMLKKGINVCIGTDGTSSNNSLNMFQEMKTGSLLQKLSGHDATLLDAKEVLKMATVNGAKALGYKNLGMIKKGCLADIVLIDMNNFSMVPGYDLFSNIVFSANGSEVNTVIVNGKIVLKNGEFLNLDEEKIIYDAKKLCKTLA